MIWPKVTDWSKRLGSWGQTVKAAQGWDSDDLGFTVDALQGTAQNFCIYDVNLEEEWTEFLKLLEECQGKGLQGLRCDAVTHDRSDRKPMVRLRRSACGA